MLGRLILLLLQIALAWFAAPQIAAKVPVPGNLSLFLYAVIFAILLYLIGLVSSHIIKEVGAPSSNTLTWSLGAALTGAVLAKFGPVYVSQVPWKAVQPLYMVLGGALLGYHIKR